LVWCRLSEVLSYSLAPSDFAFAHHVIAATRVDDAIATPSAAQHI
jgi:hypothetical protein